MYEDDPQDRVLDLLGEAIFGDHPLGRARHRHAPTVIADRRSPSIARLPRRALRAGQHRRRRRRLRRPRRARRARRAPGRAARRARSAPRPPPPPDAGAAPRRRFIEKDTEQYHICARRAGHRPRRRAPLRAARARHDLRRHDLLAALPGGAREARRSPTPSAPSTPQYADAGPRRPATSAPAPDNVGEACEVIGAELERLRCEPASPATSSPAPRRTSRAASCSSLESTVGADEPARRRAARRPADPQPRRDDRAGRRRRRVDDLAALARELLRARAPLRRRRRPERGRRFRAALAPVMPALAEAA